MRRRHPSARPAPAIVIPFVASRFRFLFLVACLFGAAVSPAVAKNYTLSNQHLSLTAPDNWTGQPSSSGTASLTLTSPDGGRLFILTATPLNPMPPIDGPGADYNLAQTLVQGSVITGFGHVTLGGVDFIGVDYQQVDSKHRGIFYFRTYATEVNDTLLAFAIATLNQGLPQNDADLTGIVKTIAFTSPPQLPPTTFHVRLMGWLYIGSGILILLVILAAIYFFIRRRLSRR
ncbi:MAG: hypothetical protein ABSE62_05340 [Chthoniobacteraceae bacterium]|jgi:hypothetical protein